MDAILAESSMTKVALPLNTCIFACKDLHVNMHGFRMLRFINIWKFKYLLSPVC